MVATEHLLRLEPPTTLADVIRHLASRGAAGVAVRGEIGEAAVEAAQESGLPLLRWTGTRRTAEASSRTTTTSSPFTAASIRSLSRWLAC